MIDMSSISSYGSSIGFGNVFNNLSNTLGMADYMINTGGYINTAQSSTIKQMQAQGMQKAMQTAQLRAQYYQMGYTKAQVDDILGVGDGSSGITAANTGADDATAMMLMMMLPQLLGGDGESTFDMSSLLPLLTTMGGTGGMTSSNSSDAALLSMLGLGSDFDFSSVLGGLFA